MRNGFGTLVRVFGFLAGMFAAGNAGAQSHAAQLYNQANALYRQGRYEIAAERYERVLAQGVENGYVYYNLGNAYYKSREIGRAILAYERALRLMPGDEDVRANLRFVNAMKADREPEEEHNILTRFLLGIYRFFRVEWLAVVCSFCLFCAVGAGGGWLLRPHRRMVWVVLLGLSGAVFGGCGTLLGFKVYERESGREAIVLAEEVVGRSGPGEDYLQVFTLHEGIKVTIERAEGSWLLVRLSNGIGGWVEVTTTERI